MTRICTTTTLWLVLVAACTWAGAPAFAAQEAVHLASVSGRVSDPQGAVVPGADVTIVPLETNVARDAVTAADGRFRFPYLPVGPYSIVVRKAGFADSIQTLVLSAGAAFELSVALNVASLDTLVTVSGAAPVIDAARSQIAGTVTQSEVRSMPLNGRNFLDLALLLPGVSPTNIGSAEREAPRPPRSSRTQERGDRVLGEGVAASFRERRP